MAPSIFLPDPIVRNILLRVPPQPWCHPCTAALVCKQWRDIIAEPHFRRWYRILHGGWCVPMLGIFCTHSRLFIPCGDPPDCVPASRFSLPAGWTILGCNQGHVILHDGEHRLLVWDPVFGGKHYVSIPDRYNHFYDFAAMLLSGDDKDEDNKDDGFHFRIVVAFIWRNTAIGMVYSSTTGAWSNEATATLSIHECYPVPAPVQDYMKPGVVVDEAVYWLLKDNRILSLEMLDGDDGKQHAIMSILDLKVPKGYKGNTLLRRTADDVLGLVAVQESCLHLLAMETDIRGYNSWMLLKTILLYSPLVPSLLPPLDHDHNGVWQSCALIIGADEEGTNVFLRRPEGIFLLRLDSTPQIKKLYPTSDEDIDQEFNVVYPYTSIFF